MYNNRVLSTRGSNRGNRSIYTTCYTSTKKKKKKKEKPEKDRERERERLIQNCPQQARPRKMIRCIRGDRICRVLSSFRQRSDKRDKYFERSIDPLVNGLREFLRGRDRASTLSRKTSRGAETRHCGPTCCTGKIHASRRSTGSLIAVHGAAVLVTFQRCECNLSRRDDRGGPRRRCSFSRRCANPAGVAF